VSGVTWTDNRLIGLLGCVGMKALEMIATLKLDVRAAILLAMLGAAAVECGGDDAPSLDAEGDAGADATGDDSNARDDGTSDGGGVDSHATNTGGSDTGTAADTGGHADAATEAGGIDGGGLASCATTPGARDEPEVLGPTSYTAPGTTRVSNVIFDGNHSDDLVRVNNGHVIFDHVTFRGIGTGSNGHTLEIKVGGSAEVRNSIFEGAPSEDNVQTEGNAPTLIACNVFATTPGEDHVDTKPGGSVTIVANHFAAPAAGRTVQNHNRNGDVNLLGNTGMQDIFYEDGATGSIVGNDIPGELWLYDVVNVLVEANVIGLAKHGEGSSDRDPVDTYFLNNVIDDAQDNGGTCFADGNSGAEPVSFCTAGAPNWYGP
jgi:hypothetical protein